MSNGIVLYYLNVAEIQDNLERASFEIKQAPVFIALCVCMCFLRFIIYLAISSILSHFYYPCLVLSGKIRKGMWEEREVRDIRGVVGDQNISQKVACKRRDRGRKW